MTQGSGSARGRRGAARTSRSAQRPWGGRPCTVAHSAGTGGVPGSDRRWVGGDGAGRLQHWIFSRNGAGAARGRSERGVEVRPQPWRTSSVPHRAQFGGNAALLWWPPGGVGVREQASLRRRQLGREKPWPPFRSQRPPSPREACMGAHVSKPLDTVQRLSAPMPCWRALGPLETTAPWIPPKLTNDAEAPLPVLRHLAVAKHHFLRHIIAVKAGHSG